jgi:DinB family protein
MKSGAAAFAGFAPRGINESGGAGAIDMGRKSTIQVKKESDVNRPVAEWNKIAGKIRNSIRGLNETDLGLRGGSEGWSIRENVHHLVEANLVASNMIIAALATNGSYYDWTWVNPDKSWMQRVGYDTADVGPAIETLRALCQYISGLLGGRPGALARTVKLNDAPGATRYVMTVEKILWQEVEHANDHLGDIRSTRKLHSR